jgi:hypothetical protein
MVPDSKLRHRYDKVVFTQEGRGRRFVNSLENGVGPGDIPVIRTSNGIFQRTRFEVARHLTDRPDRSASRAIPTEEQ